MVYEYICWNEIFVDMDKMLEKLMEQEAMIIKEDKQYLQEDIRRSARYGTRRIWC